MEWTGPAPTSASMGMPSTERPSRSVPIDAARVLAAVMIVWLHTIRVEGHSYLAEAGRFGVPFFAAAAAYLLIGSVARRPDLTLGNYTASRATRLLVPYLLWAAIYMALRNSKRLLDGRAPQSMSFAFLFSGLSHHLWFLPFLFAAGLLLFPIAKIVFRGPRWRAGVAAAAVVAGVAVAFAPPLPQFGRPFPDADGLGWLRHVVSSSWDTIPALCWGLAFSLVATDERLRRGGVMALAYVIVSGACMWFVMSDGRSRPVENLAGLAWLLAALSIPEWGWVRRIATLAPLSFGIYLSHVAILEILRAGRVNLGRPETLGSDVCIFFITLLASFVLCSGLAKSRLGKWLAP